MRGFYNSQNERGSSLVGAVMAMLVMGYLGATMTQQNSSSAAVSTNEIQASQALYLAQAGVETGFARLNSGELADGQLNFSNGSATISTNPTAGTMTVTGVVGSARKMMTVMIDPNAHNDGTPGAGYRSQIGFASDCIHFDTTGAYLEGAQLKGVKLVKTCNDEVDMTALAADWWYSNCAVNNSYDGDMDDDGLADVDDPVDCDGGKFLACHGSSPAHTMCVSPSGWTNGHNSGQGNHSTDYLGACVGAGSIGSSLDSCSDDAGGMQMIGVYLDNLIGGQDSGDLLFSGAANHGEYVTTVRTFTNNADYKFGVTPSNDAIVFNMNMPGRVTFTLKAKFKDGSQIESAVSVAYSL